MKTTQNRPVVLLADDDTDARETLESILSRKYPTAVFYSVADGRTALEYFREYQPEIVITDVIMPEMDGIKLTREIRAIKAATKLIMLTGLSDLAESEDQPMVETIIDHYILKPVDLGKLFAAIDECMAGLDIRKGSGD